MKIDSLSFNPNILNTDRFPLFDREKLYDNIFWIISPYRYQEILERTGISENDSGNIIKNKIFDIFDKFKNQYDNLLDSFELDDFLKLYTKAPFVPRIKTDILSTEEHGLNIKNKLFGIGDLRCNFYLDMRYREGKNPKDIINNLWPRDRHGFPLKSILQMDLGLQGYLLQSIVGEDSVFYRDGHSYDLHNILLFGSTKCKYDYDIDIIGHIIDGPDESNISDDDYINILLDLKILEEIPNNCIKLTLSDIDLDLDIFAGNYWEKDAPKFNKSQNKVLDKIRNKLYWRKDEDEIIDYSSHYFGGKPGSQQGPQRYYSANGKLMTPFFRFSDPEDDLTHQIYLGQKRSNLCNTVYGKLDSSGT